MPSDLRERLLAVMDRKNHWAWPSFAEGRVPLQRLLPHFQQEWEVYVRDFPVLLARVLGHGPPQRVRTLLAANIYEEQTGGVSGTRPHPELFLKMMDGCTFARDRFEGVKLLPGALAYRSFLEEVSGREPWILGAAALTLFVEGSVNERRELAALEGPKASAGELDEAIRRHPLVRLHGVAPEALELVRVHKLVEGGHRADAWEAVLGYVTPAQEEAVVRVLERALELWLGFRDAVAGACGLDRAMH